MKGFLSFSGSDDTFFNVAMPWVKLMDEKKEFKKQQKLQKQAVQQPQSLQMGNSNLVEMRAPSKEFIDIAFDGPKEVRI